MEVNGSWNTLSVIQSLLPSLESQSAPFVHLMITAKAQESPYSLYHLTIPLSINPSYIHSKGKGTRITVHSNLSERKQTSASHKPWLVLFVYLHYLLWITQPQRRESRNGRNQREKNNGCSETNTDSEASLLCLILKKKSVNKGRGKKRRCCGLFAMCLCFQS